jgi:hypothetical protein
MSDLTHDIPAWYIPDGTQVIANEAEKEEIEEEGELEEPLCPHCGRPYKREKDDTYIHEYRHKSKRSSEVEPAKWCNSYQKRCSIKQFPWGADF